MHSSPFRVNLLFTFLALNLALTPHEHIVSNSLNLSASSNILFEPSKNSDLKLVLSPKQITEILCFLDIIHISSTCFLLKTELHLLKLHQLLIYS